MTDFGKYLGVALWCCASAVWAEDGRSDRGGASPVPDIVSAGGYKSCARLAQIVVERLGLDGDPDSYSDCRRWPPNDVYSLVAASGPCRSAKDEPGAEECDLDLVLVSSFDGRFLRHLHQDGEIDFGAMRFTGLRLDIAPYQLSPEVRAFGVRLLGEGISHGSIETLSLYMEEGRSFRQVLHDLTVQTGDWGSDGDVTGDNVTVAIAKTMHQGFADLRAISSSREVLGNARGTSNAHRMVMMYVYDGSTYRELQAP